MSTLRLKLCLYLSLLLALPCGACERTTIEATRKDVEKALVSKSFLDIADRYAASQQIRVVLENEYDEANPTVTLTFKNLAELSKWFFEKHEYSEHMIIPSAAVCRAEGCKYQLPESTLHHGIYLLGFETRQVGRCTSFTQLHVHWG
jgi:hypothetical protein